MVRRLLKSCATPPVSWPIASIFCDWRSTSSARRALGDVDGFRDGADHGAMLIEQRPHRKVEIALADRQAELHLPSHGSRP